MRREAQVQSRTQFRVRATDVAAIQSTPEAARLLSLSRATAYRWLRLARAAQSVSENPSDFRLPTDQNS
jgi:tRNA threonylcarbamoyladenosine modification (KEOPS) complex  Pcc1 subunit